MQSNKDTDHAAGVGQRPARLARSAALALALLAGSASAQQDALQVARPAPRMRWEHRNGASSAIGWSTIRRRCKESAWAIPPSWAR
mgnify:CR=1 FL=1|jgi:hypothetical protein